MRSTLVGLEANDQKVSLKFGIYDIAETKLNLLKNSLEILLQGKRGKS